MPLKMEIQREIIPFTNFMQKYNAHACTHVHTYYFLISVLVNNVRIQLLGLDKYAMFASAITPLPELKILWYKNSECKMPFCEPSLASFYKD